MSAWIMPNGHICIPDNTPAGAMEDVSSFGCRWNGGYCTTLSGGDGREYDCPSEQTVLAQLQPTPAEQVAAGAVFVLDEGQYQRELSRPGTSRPATSRPATAAEAVTKGIEDAVDSVFGFFGKGDQQQQQPASYGQQVEQPPSTSALAPQTTPVHVEQASMFPSGALPWVAGGLIILAVGAGVWAMWPRKRGF